MAEKLKIELVVEDKGSVVVKQFGKTAESSLKKTSTSAQAADKKIERFTASWKTLAATAGAGLGGFFGGAKGGGGGTVAPEELYPGIAHKGGTIGRDIFPTRHVAPEIFYQVPRLHAGLGMNEFPAILERGETVIPKEGRTQGVQINVNNFIYAMDSRSFDDFSRRNPGAFLRPYKEALIRGDRELRELIRAAR